jgi:hypothetical protein
MRADRASYYGLSGLEPQSQACQKTRADRFPEREQILGEINIANPVHRLLAKGDGMQGVG